MLINGEMRKERRNAQCLKAITGTWNFFRLHDWNKNFENCVQARARQTADDSKDFFFLFVGF